MNEFDNEGNKNPEDIENVQNNQTDAVNITENTGSTGDNRNIQDEQQNYYNPPERQYYNPAFNSSGYSQNTAETNNYGYYNTGSSQVNNSDFLKSAPFYTENYKKPKVKKQGGLKQILLVALVSSIIGGLVVGSLITFVAPSIQPAVRNFFGSNTAGSSNTQGTGTAAYKQVEIVQNGDSPVAAIAEKVGPSVVGVRTTFVSNSGSNFFFDAGGQQEAGEGSGIIIRSDGYILTNNHVIQDAVNPNTGKLASGAKLDVFLSSQNTKPYPATLVGYDSKSDLAILKISATNLPVAEFGDSDAVKVGELAVAIGNPGGMELAGSVTTGVISGLNRTITEDNSDMKLIQTDAAINPGNSGGALVNSKGQIIGINELKIAQTGFEGLGFAIPSNAAKKVADNLIDHGYVAGRPFLGISSDPRYTPDVAKQNNMPAGVYVANVELLSGAQKAGIQVGDVVTKINGKAVASVDELNTIKNTYKVGDSVTLEIYRNGKTFTVKVTLGEDKSNN
ncbi:MAG: trypsin-like peptidase domain-containing protein [Bacillota bacterium]|nr:trypsin-like peptidase domain-containing protein [Bacillota bacterium]